VADIESAPSPAAPQARQSTITFTDWDKSVTISAPRPGGN